MNDRLSRSERRALQRREEEILARPIDLNSQDPRPVAAHVRHLIHLLRSPKPGSPSSEAVKHLAALYDRSVPTAAQKMVVCRRGCSHCCTQMVSLTAPEVFFVAAQIRSNANAVAAVQAANAQTRGLSLEQRLRTGLMCPMLKDHACSIYAARPLGCHGFVSVDLSKCISAFVDGGEPNIPTPSEFTAALDACRIALLASLRLARLNDAFFELNEALSAVLSQEDAEARWLRGEDVFAGVTRLPPPPPQYEMAIQQMAAFVAPSL